MMNQFWEGFNDFLKGTPSPDNPYIGKTNKIKEDLWQRGWEAALKAYEKGINDGAAGTHVMLYSSQRR